MCFLTGGDDFRKALQIALSSLKELEDLARPEGSLSSGSTSKSPTGFQTATTVELDKKRIELMGKLIEVLKRHLRVKYEMNFNDILQAYEVFSMRTV